MITNSLKENVKKCESECRPIVKAYEFFTELSRPYAWYDAGKGSELYLIYDIDVKRNVASSWWQIDDIEFRGPSYDYIVLKLMNYKNGKEHKITTNVGYLTDNKDDSVTLDKLLEGLKVRIPTDEELNFPEDIPGKTKESEVALIKRRILDNQGWINERKNKIANLESKVAVQKELLKDLERKIEAVEAEINCLEIMNKSNEKVINDNQEKLKEYEVQEIELTVGE